MKETEHYTVHFLHEQSFFLQLTEDHDGLERRTETRKAFKDTLGEVRTPFGNIWRKSVFVVTRILS